MKSTPSIWFITRKWPPAMGGMETYSVRLTEELSKRTEVRISALPGHADGGVPSGRELIRFGLKTAMQILRAKDPVDVIHVADMASWPLAFCARLRFPGSLVALSAHGTDVAYPLKEGWKARAYGVYLRLGARFLPAAMVIANSAATAEITRNHGFRRVEIVPLASDAAAPRDAPHAPDTILFSGRLVRRKGLSWFVRHVLPELPGHIRLQVAGTHWDPEEIAALADDRVIDLGKLDRDALDRAYQCALCVVVPNIGDPKQDLEGFGLVAVEAASAGGVVLAAVHSGLRDAVKDGQTGFLLPSGDADAWRSKITEIAAWDDEQRKEFTDRARQICRDFYSWERVAEDTLDRLRDCVRT